jgi:antirestriction protein ArdC
MEDTKPSPQLLAHFGICNEVNAKILARVEKGSVPWYRPWTGAGIPRNIYSGKEYQGINVLLLTIAGYEHNAFITYRQLQEIGGKVRKGEHGHLVCHWQYPDANEKAQGKTKGLLRRYLVFNVAQCEDIPDTYLAKVAVPTEFPQCEIIVRSMPNCPTIKHRGKSPRYDVIADCISMPNKRLFDIDEIYYSALFQQLVHSTGHTSRLARECLGNDVARYSLEDLIAVVGTWHLESLTGIVPYELKASTEYIASWLTALKADRWLIFKAASYAQKAVAYILNESSSQKA